MTRRISGEKRLIRHSIPIGLDPLLRRCTAALVRRLNDTNMSVRNRVFRLVLQANVSFHVILPRGGKVTQLTRVFDPLVFGVFVLLQ